MAAVEKTAVSESTKLKPEASGIGRSLFSGHKVMPNGIPAMPPIVPTAFSANADRVKYRDLEFQITRYLLDRCVDAPPAYCRVWKKSATFLSLLVAVPALTFIPLVILPMEHPEKGLWSNWTFKFVGHPILNYGAGRGMVECLVRSLDRAERHRLWRITCFVPLVVPVWCIAVHAVFSIAGIFPIPLSSVVSCITGILVACCVARWSLPVELRTPEFEAFLQFIGLNWVAWIVQYVMLLYWNAGFAVMSQKWQVVSTIGVTAVLAFFTWLMPRAAAHFWNLPESLLSEAKSTLFFVSLFFTATVIGKAKAWWVVLTLVLTDAGKALGIAVVMLASLVSTLESVEAGDCPDNHPARWADGQVAPGTEQDPSCRRAAFYGLWRSFSVVRQQMAALKLLMPRMQAIVQTAESTTQAEFLMRDISHADACLINKLGIHLTSLCTVEMCELVIPMFYMMMASLLHSETFGYNRQFFLGFASETTAQYSDGMIGNAVAVAVEALVFLVLQLLMVRAFGFNLLEFLGTLILQEYWFFAFFMSACFIAWLVVIVEHGGFHMIMAFAAE